MTLETNRKSVLSRFAILLILFINACSRNAGDIGNISAKISSDFGIQSHRLEQKDLLPQSVIF
jgi:hypothetical protein